MTDRTGRDVTDAEVTLLEVAPPDAAVLDNPGWHALRGADRGLAVPGPPGGGEPARDGRAARYRPEVSPFAAVADERDPAAWADLASLAGAEPVAVMCALVPDGWTELEAFPVIRMVHRGTADGLAGGYAFASLGPADVPEMLALAAATAPGPFAPETIAFGGYRGYRAGGALVCMAGERLHPGEWTEVSAVCTAPAHQGRGLAGAIVSSLVTDIRAAGRRPFLHVTVTNPARRLYERLGFTEHARVVVRVLRPPAA